MLKVSQNYDEQQRAAEEVWRLHNEEGWAYSFKKFDGKDIVLLLPPSGGLTDLIISRTLLEAIQQINSR